MRPHAATQQRRRLSLLARAVLLLTGALLTAMSLAGTSLAGTATGGDGAEPRVLATRIDSTITQVTAEVVREGIDRAEREGFAAYVLELDTPGGALAATREIVQAELDSPVPVVVHVAPAGARAASAGALITLAGHVAAMAPATEIGAATPVGAGGGGDLSQKIVNDTAAYAASIAEARGRDVEFARLAVTEGLSVTAEEAVQRGAVDLLASSLGGLLEQVDGQSVTVAGGEPVQLTTAGASVVRDDPGLLRRVQGFLAAPGLAFLLLAVALVGLLIELSSPGVGVGGVVAVVAGVLAMFSLSVLPVQATGIALLVLAGALLLAEVLAPGIGVFAAGGAVCLVLAGTFLFEDASGVRLDPALVVPTAVVLAVGAVLVGRFGLRGRADPSSTTGVGALVGRLVTVAEADGRTGRGRLDGTWWKVRSDGQPLSAGQTGRVTGVDDLTLVLEPDQQSATTQENS